MGDRPHVLVIVTTGEQGGAQTFVRELTTGLVGRYRFTVAAQGSDGVLQRACAEAGISFHPLRYLRRSIHPAHDMTAVAELARSLSHLRPELVQLNSSKAGVVGRLAAKLAGTPVVFTAHGWAFSTGARNTRAYALVERAMAPLADAIVCVSAADRHLALKHRVGRASQLHVIHNGIHAPTSLPAPRSWPDRPRLACIARLSAQKDISLVLHALTRPGLGSWSLSVFGDGPERAAVERQINDLHLADRVVLHGDVPDVRGRLSRFDAFVLPSNWEGLPFSILEAMAAGLPVVASNVGGVSEAVVHEETGLLVERGDVGGMAAALRRLHENGAWARKLGRAGHARVRARFGLDRMLDRYDALFASLLGTETRGRAVG
ncbi:MAG TPA: glycosyltransferase family 4 protein [Gaiellaceae bacterium]|nr:glycosyltransferase family 4 protein [Gaiellaceae bacterium]